MKYIINRNEWARGDRPIEPGSTVLKNNLLLDKEGMKCCLGFVCLQEGIKPEILLEQGLPAELPVKPPEWLAIFKEADEDKPSAFYQTEYCQAAITANDAKMYNFQIITPELREWLITGIFQAAGHDVEFV